jgi:hypothetical protein
MKNITLFESFTVVKAPNKLPTDDRPSVFLAGSIEMGKARDWQTDITNLLADENINVLNPRRDNWDNKLEQSIENDVFRGQVTWELDGLDKCFVIMMYFDPKTKAPITLAELGLYASSGKILVCCPKGFYRKGNVDVICARYNIPMFDSIEEMVGAAKVKLSQFKKETSK